MPNIVLFNIGYIPILFKIYNVVQRRAKIKIIDFAIYTGWKFMYCFKMIRVIHLHS